MSPLLKKEKIIINGDVKSFIQKHEYSENLADFRAFFNKNKEKLIKPKRMTLLDIFNNKALKWVLSSALIVMIAGSGAFYFFGFLPLQQLQKGKAFVVTIMNGNVMLQKKGNAAWSKIKLMESIADGDRLKSDKGGSCELQMINKGVYRLDKEAEVSVSIARNEKGAMDIKFFLSRGRILLNPRPLLKDESFGVETSTLSAGVKGTKFSVEIDSNSDNLIKVSEGSVLVKTVLSSIGKAEEKGMLDKMAGDILQNKLAGPFIVASNESMTLKKQTGDILEAAVNKVIEKEYQKYKRPIDAQTLNSQDRTLNNGRSGADNIVDSIEKNYLQTLKAANILKKQNYSESIIEKVKLSPADLNEFNQLEVSGTIKNAFDMAEISIGSEPAEADVYIDNLYAGRTPFEKILEKGGKISLRISKDGFSDYIESKFLVSGKLAVHPMLQKLINLKSGELVWNREMSLDNPEKGAYLYQGKIIIPDGSQLKIASIEGELLSTTKVVDSKYVITKPAVDSGIIYLGSDYGGLYAYSVSGELVWKNLSAGKAMYNASPVSQNGMIALPTFDKGIQIFNQKGRLLDTILIKNGEAVYSTPVIIKNGNVLIYGTETGNVSAYDIKNKKNIWSKSVFNDRIVYPIAGNDQAIYVLSREEGKIISLNPSDGTVLWMEQFDSVKKTALQPLFSKDRLILFSNSENGNSILILDGKTGKLDRKFDFKDRIAFPYLAEDHLFIGTERGRIYDYNLATMNKDWAVENNNPVSLIAADGRGVYVLSRGGMIKIAR